jgi:nucleoid DNA-binding protein
MSRLSQAYRLHYADTNTMTSLKLFNGAGVELTPESITDHEGPSGWKYKSISFAEAVEAVFATPTWQNPNAPVPVYLTIPGDGDFGVLDEVEFHAGDPCRPTPKGEYALQYESSDLGGYGHTWHIIAPTYFTPRITPRTKDPLTFEKLYGNDFRMLWTGKFPDHIEVEVDVEDITDPAGFSPVPYTNVTGYAEYSAGRCLVKLDSEVIPQDGFIHALKFRIRYHFSGDVGDWVEGEWQKAMYALPAPNPPTNVTVSVLRDRIDNDIPDRIQIDWAWAVTYPGDAVEVYAIDTFNKKHLLVEETDNAISTATVENVTRFYTVPRPPAVQTPYRFGVLAKNRSSKSSMTMASSSVMLTSRIADDTPPTPDEVAGTAEELTYPEFLAKAASDCATAQGNLTSEQRAYMSSLMGYSAKVLFDAIKKVVMRGGQLTISDFGTFKAKWSKDKMGRNPATGEPVFVPASRGQGFTASTGYKVGTARGELLTDAQAKLLD